METKEKYFKLPKRIKTAWVEALRSGKYKQGIETLVRTDSKGRKTYCCLGVLCQVLGYTAPERGILPRKGYAKYPMELRTDKYSKAMPITEKLITLNDSDNWGFKRIATWIEKNL